MAENATRIVHTDAPARLDRLPWGRFHWMVVAAPLSLLGQ
jgi:hypothetical protein